MTSATSCLGIKRVTFVPVFRSHTTLASSSMGSTSDCDYSRKLIKYMVQMQDDFVHIPELSSKQKKDLMDLRRRLIDLDLHTEDMRIKPALIELMNSLNQKSSLHLSAGKKSISHSTNFDSFEIPNLPLPSSSKVLLNTPKRSGGILEENNE